jgi:lipoprotein-anchoring transpeptidase ErfK/SrfK
MKRTSILRFLCSAVAVLVLATAGLALTLHLSRVPIAGAAPAAGDPMPTTTAPSTTTTSTSTTTTSTSTTTVPPTMTTLRPGDQSAAVRDLQGRLRDLGYWLGEPDGNYRLLTTQAVTAFQKVEGLAPDGVAGPSTLAALAAAHRPTGASTTGDLVEIDKARQVLFVVRAGAVAWTLNVSTGTEEPYVVNGRSEMADTPVGRWTVQWVVDGVDVGALGALYRPRYFHPDGIAVHGYSSVPAHPASHGCVRVTESAMDWIWATNVMPLGSTVWVR